LDDVDVVTIWMRVQVSLITPNFDEIGKEMTKMKKVKFKTQQRKKNFKLVKDKK
jgi:hypothetical protein